MQDVFIVEALRTPIGKYGGILKDVRPDDLAAAVVKAVVNRAGIPPAEVDDVFFGDANQAGEDNRNVARMATLLAELPVRIPGTTVNRLCGSGLQAVVSAAREIQVGACDIVIAGGVESMTRAPLVMPKPDTEFARGNRTVYDTTLGWRMVNPRLAAMYPPISLGETAENVATKYGISRVDQDSFAFSSHRKAVAAQDACRFAREIVSVETPGRKGSADEATQDEGPRRDSTLEKLARLPTAFVEGGSVTAGNSSQINDGAAALLLASGSVSRELDLKPLARFLDAATAGVDPSFMGMGPVPATEKLLRRLAMSISDIDIVEINEAFASQALACIRELGIDERRVNPNGGAIALGHPLGASGARLVTTLVYELHRTGARYGLTTMCIGVGQGISAVFERVDG